MRSTIDQRRDPVGGRRRIVAADLDGRSPERTIPGRNRTKADILVYRLGDLPLAVKQYGRRPWPIRQTVGRWLVARECAAYEAAGSVDGLPRFLGRLDPWSLATELVPARPIGELQPCGVDETIVDRLDAVVDRLHARGLALGDLHHRDVLVGDDGRVWVVDLATALSLGAAPGRWRRRLVRRLQDGDRVALHRIRLRFLGRPAADGGPDAAALARHRRARRLKRLWDRVRGAGRRRSTDGGARDGAR